MDVVPFASKAFRRLQQTFVGVVLVCATRGRAWANTYATDFPNDEDPISEGGHWTNGAVVGLDWGNAATAGGVVQARLNNGGGPSYNDSTALLTGTWGPDQSVTATVHRSSGVVEGDYPEVEIRLRSSLMTHSCTGYEIMWSLRSDASCYVAIVRWNGPFGNFTILEQVMGTQYVLGDGAKVTATIAGNAIAAYIGNQVVVATTDATYTAGTPGVGFDHNGPSADDNAFGFTDFVATDEMTTSTSTGSSSTGAGGASTSSTGAGGKGAGGASTSSTGAGGKGAGTGAGGGPGGNEAGSGGGMQADGGSVSGVAASAASGAGGATSSGPGTPTGSEPSGNDSGCTIRSTPAPFGLEALGALAAFGLVQARARSRRGRSRR